MDMYALPRAVARNTANKLNKDALQEPHRARLRRPGFPLLQMDIALMRTGEPAIRNHRAESRAFVPVAPLAVASSSNPPSYGPTRSYGWLLKPDRRRCGRKQLPAGKD
jgi:hypothetical protein